MNKNEIIKRLKNPSTIIAIASSVIAILVNLGIDVESEIALNIVNSICTIGLSIGILNNPSTKGIDSFRKGK